LKHDIDMDGVEGRRGESGKHPTVSRDTDALHFRALVGSQTYAIVTLDLDLRLLTWNAGAERLFGATAQQMVGKNLAVLLTEVDAPLASLSEGIRRGETLELEARLRHDAGATIDTYLTATPTRDHDGQIVGTAMIIRDVSQAKQLERRLRDASQIEVIGRIAAGIAHDINNVLAIVQSYAEFVAAGPLTSEQSQDLRLAQEAASRGALLTHQLLNLGRRRELTPVIGDLSDLVRGLDELLRRSLGHAVTLSTRLSLSRLRVRSQPGQVDQILLNLVLNARDAMPSGGQLTIEVRSAVVTPVHQLSSKLRPGSYAVLAVSDSGLGMDAQTLARIFEPLYTTKAPGRGSGLGLSVVQETVRELGGAIEVQSKLGQGTTFEVYLPIADEHPDAEAPSETVTGGPLTALIVEDDPVLRGAMRRMLKSSGYTLLLAANGREAEEIARNHPGRIDVLLSDLLLPGAAGLDVIKRIQQLRPQLRVVVVSGQQPPPAEEIGAHSFVAKPFTGAQLLGALMEASNAVKQPSQAAARAPRVLVVDDDEQLVASMVRLMKEEDLEATAAKSGLHALQQLKEAEFDVLVTDQYMPGMEGVKLLELVAQQYPHVQRILFTAHASPDVVLSAVNRGRVAKVLLKNMHPIHLRDEILAVANEAMRLRLRAAP
jgi:PAS domain S-box-containing protein